MPATAARRGHLSAAITTSTLRLTSQSPTVVQAGGTLTVDLSVQSPLPATDLGFELFLYPSIKTVNSFGTLPTLPASPGVVGGSLPLAKNDTAPTEVAASLALNIATSAPAAPGVLPTLVLNGGAGVYPLTVALVTRAEGTVLTRLTTHVIYISGAATVPLRVGLALPIGTSPALNPAHAAALSGGSLATLGAEISALNSHTRTTVSVALYPQLLVALEEAAATRRAARGRLTMLRGVLTRGSNNGNVELLRTTFTPTNVSALAAAGLGGDLAAQLSRAAGAAGVAFPGIAIDPTAPYVTTGRLSDAGLGLLAAAGVGTLVVPAADIDFSLPHLQTAPFSLFSERKNPAGSAPLALPSYPALDDELSAPGDDPVLAGHELLAELAQIYFDDPALTQPRAVVVAPGSLPSGASTVKSLLDTVLGGLSANPILSTSTLTSLFDEVPTGSNGATWNASSAPLQPSGTLDALPARAIDSAHSALAVYHSIARLDTTRENVLEDDILVSEGADLSERARLRFTAAVNGILPEFRRSLSISSSRRVALTSLRGKIPVTIKVAWPAPGPLRVVLRLSSAEDALSFPGTANRSEPLSLQAGDNSENITVTARTSGAFDLALELVSPRGSVVLFRSSDFSVRSTAISGEAIALSVAALAVLLAWWIRSILRSRRRRALPAGVLAPE